MSALLEVSGLSKAFGGVRAVSQVSFNVAAGELLAMIGPNGAGKSTCFNRLNGQLQDLTACEPRRKLRPRASALPTPNPHPT